MVREGLEKQEEQGKEYWKQEEGDCRPKEVKVDQGMASYIYTCTVDAGN